MKTPVIYTKKQLFPHLSAKQKIIQSSYHLPDFLRYKILKAGVIDGM